MEQEDTDVVQLFQQPEDIENDEEEYIEEVQVGGQKYCLTLTDDDGTLPGPLFASNIWNGAKVIANYIADHSNEVEDKSIVEFGAASALPSLVALHMNARAAVITDYPVEALLSNIRANIQRNAHLCDPNKSAVRGHLWGDATTELVDQLQAISSSQTNAQHGFDVAIVAECLWLHNLHEKLLQSIHSCLAPGGIALVSFAHHVPGHEANDLSFFEKAKKNHNFHVTHLSTLSVQHMYSSHKQVDQFLYQLTKQ